MRAFNREMTEMFTILRLGLETPGCDGVWYHVEKVSHLVGLMDAAEECGRYDVLCVKCAVTDSGWAIYIGF